MESVIVRLMLYIHLDKRQSQVLSTIGQFRIYQRDRGSHGREADRPAAMHHAETVQM
jgi:hypothetical protein